MLLILNFLKDNDRTINRGEHSGAQPGEIFMSPPVLGQVSRCCTRGALCDWYSADGYRTIQFHLDYIFFSGARKDVRMNKIIVRIRWGGGGQVPVEKPQRDSR